MPMSVCYTVIDGEIIHENRGGVERFYVPDSLGNTAALVDTAGNVTDTFTYWPYGEVQSHTGSSTTPFTFVGTWGYFMDSSTQGYVRARNVRYDLTRWTTTDSMPTIFQAPGFPYNYAGSAPSLLIDVDGDKPHKPSKPSKPPQSGCDAMYSDCMNCVGQIISNLSTYAGTISACVGGPLVPIFGIGPIVINNLNKQLQDECAKFARDCSSSPSVYCDALAKWQCQTSPDPNCWSSHYSACRRKFGPTSPPIRPPNFMPNIPKSCASYIGPHNYGK